MVCRRTLPEGLKWFRGAANQGYAEAQTGLGAMYQNGFGVPRDYDSE
jgi:TPR repeat protein